MLLLALGVSGAALAQPITSQPLSVDPVTAADGGVGEKPKDRPAYRGTAISYSHSASVFTFSPTAEPHYNPTWGHRLMFLPEWHFGDVAAVRGRFSLYQEFTESDSTNTLREVEVSDVWLDGVWTGWKEKVTGLHVAADVRVTLPTSKVSQLQSRLFTLGPSVSLSRTFNVLKGLTLSYAARFTYRFNRYTTLQNQGPTLPACGDARAPECQDFINTGGRASVADILHGPTVSFTPHDKFNVAASFLMMRGWLPALAPLPAEVVALKSTQLDANAAVTTRDFTAFWVAATYTPHPFVSVSLTSYSFSPQLTADSQYYFPLFNRNTSLYLDATFDLEGFVSLFPKEKP